MSLLAPVPYTKNGRVTPRVVSIGKSQPAKIRDLSRLNSNLSRLKKKKVSSTCLPHNLPCLLFESSNTFLTYTWLRQTGQQHFLGYRSGTLQVAHTHVKRAWLCLNWRWRAFLLSPFFIGFRRAHNHRSGTLQVAQTHVKRAWLCLNWRWRAFLFSPFLIGFRILTTFVKSYHSGDSQIYPLNLIKRHVISLG